MATAAAGNYWPSSPPLRPSPVPDTTSPVYPDRPIRPLPKRRLRDRLSTEQSESIQFPPNPPSASPIFGYPYVQGEQDRSGRASRPLRAGSGASEQACADCGHDHSELDSDEEEEEDVRQRAMQFSPDSLQIMRRDGDYYGNGKAAMRSDWDSKPAPPGSTASSADGYESFENTNNKKKRKIPQSNVSGHAHHSALSADLANMGISQRDGGSDPLEEGVGSAGTSYGYAHNSTSAGSPGTGLSGPGRGRYGRSGRGSLDRKPLGASTNGLNAAAVGRTRQASYTKTASQPAEPGIISTAIANAAQQMSPTPTKGQENVSLLQQQASKSPPQKTDFTFTPEGGENRPVWPGQQMAPAGHYPPPPPGSAVRRPQGTQTSPNMNGVPQMPTQPNQQNHSQQQVPHGQQPQGQPAAQGQAPQKPKKPRRPSKLYALAARQRKLQQEYQNFHNPPRREDIWICEFCEYEDIYGKPPAALIRQYEIKDRKERKRIAERRRLLEKAKMKGRKGKKGSNKKNNANNQNNNQNNQQHQPPANNQRYDAPVDDQLGSEEYYEDEEYEYGADPAMDLPPTPHPSHPGQAGANGAYPGDYVEPSNPSAKMGGKISSTKSTTLSGHPAKVDRPVV